MHQFRRKNEQAIGMRVLNKDSYYVREVAGNEEFGLRGLENLVPALDYINEHNMTNFSLDGRLQELDAKDLLRSPQITDLGLSNCKILNAGYLTCLPISTLVLDDCFCFETLDFAEFKELNKATAKYSKHLANIADAPKLETLTLRGYNSKMSDPLRNNSGLLTELGLLYSTLEDYSCLEVPALKRLEFDYCKPTNSLKGLKKLNKLRALNVPSTLTDDYSEISSLVDLAGLSLLGKGDVKSISWIRSLKKLSHFTSFVNIVDGDLTPLLELRELKWINLTGKPHYSHSKREILAHIKQATKL